MTLARAFGALSLLLLLSACEVVPPAAPPHHAPWSPSELVLAPTKFVANKTGRVGFEVSANGWVYAGEKAIYHVDGARIFDAKGMLVAKLEPSGALYVVGVERPAQVSGSYDPEDGQGFVRAKLHFADTDLVIDEDGKPMVVDTAQAPPAPRLLDAHFAPYDAKGAVLDEILLALLMLPRQELAREPATITGPMEH